MAITRIYNHYIVNTHYTFDLKPYNVDERQDWFRQFDDRGPYRLFVASEGEDIIGFAFSSRIRQKAAYDSSIETTIYLDPQHVGDGTGEHLYTGLFDALARERLHRAYAGIALPNKPSVALHERLGFERVGIFHEVGWKFDRYWDVAWYQRAL